jgi:hypothetical protein
LQVIWLLKKLDWPTQWSTSRGTEPASILYFQSRDGFQHGLEDGLVIFFPWGSTLSLPLVLVSINTHGRT